MAKVGRVRTSYHERLIPNRYEVFSPIGPEILKVPDVSPNLAEP